MADEIHVLYVDDDEVALEVRGGLLADSESISVQREQDPTSAMARLAQEDIDCVLSDFKMPGQDGLECLDTVRSTHPRLPFILFSSIESKELAETALDANATDFVPKSLCAISYRLLANRIQRAVEYHRFQEQLQGERV